MPAAEEPVRELPEIGAAVWLPANAAPGEAFTEETPFGPLLTRMWSGDEGEIHYHLQVGQFEQPIPDEAALLTTLTGFMMGPESVDEGAVELAGHPGRALRTEQDGAVLRARLYVAGRRVYEVRAIAPTGRAEDPAIDRFFGSLRLLD